MADRYFFETVVRLHRAGEGADFTGLKPAGLSNGPVIPLAERAVLTGSGIDVVDFLTGELHVEIERRLARVHPRGGRERSVADARRYVEAMLGFEVYCHHLYTAVGAHSETRKPSPTITAGRGGAHGRTRAVRGPSRQDRRQPRREVGPAQREPTRSCGSCPRRAPLAGSLYAAA